MFSKPIGLFLLGGVGLVFLSKYLWDDPEPVAKGGGPPPPPNVDPDEDVSTAEYTCDDAMADLPPTFQAAVEQLIADANWTGLNALINGIESGVATGKIEKQVGDTAANCLRKIVTVATAMGGGGGGGGGNTTPPFIPSMPTMPGTTPNAILTPTQQILAKAFPNQQQANPFAAPTGEWPNVSLLPEPWLSRARATIKGLQWNGVVVGQAWCVQGSCPSSAALYALANELSKSTDPNLNGFGSPRVNAVAELTYAASIAKASNL